MSSTLKERRRTFLNLFPAPEFLMLSTSGISITDYDTKFVELKREIMGDGFRLVHSNQTINPEGAISGGIISNKDAIVSTLKEFASHYGVHSARATLPDERAYLFTTTIDRPVKEAMRDAVAFIVEENAPVSLADSVFDYSVIADDHRSSKIRVAVAVLSRDLVASYIDVFESAGILPVSFDLESQAIARAVIRSGDKSPYLLINFAPHKTGFYVVESGLVQFSTTLGYGLDENSVDSASLDLGTEMRKVLGFWEAHISANSTVGKIEKAILCGRGLVENNFVANFMSENNLSYERSDVWLNLSASSRARISPEMLNESLEYATAIGAALSGRRTKHV